MSDTRPPGGKRDEGAATAPPSPARSDGWPTLTIRLPGWMMDDLRNAAAGQGETLAAYIRGAILQRMRRDRAVIDGKVLRVDEAAKGEETEMEAIT